MKIKQIIAIFSPGWACFRQAQRRLLPPPFSSSKVGSSISDVPGTYQIGVHSPATTLRFPSSASVQAWAFRKCSPPVIMTWRSRGVHFLGGTIQVGDVSCQTLVVPSGPACSGTLRFIRQPLRFVPDLFHEAPFTMTGQLVIGQVGLPNLIFDIEGSGIVTGVVQTSGGFLPLAGTQDRLQRRLSIRGSRTVKCIAAVHWGQCLACRAPKTGVGRPPRSGLTLVTLPCADSAVHHLQCWAISSCLLFACRRGSVLDSSAWTAPPFS